MLLLVNIIDVKTHIFITSIIINDLQGDRETWKLIVFLVTYNSGLGYYCLSWKAQIFIWEIKIFPKKKRYLPTIFKYLEFRHPYSKEMDGLGSLCSICSINVL